MQSGRASEPAGKSLELAGRSIRWGGRKRKKRTEHVICGCTIGHRPLRGCCLKTTRWTEREGDRQTNRQTRKGCSFQNSSSPPTFISGKKWCIKHKTNHRRDQRVKPIKTDRRRRDALGNKSVIVPRKTSIAVVKMILVELVLAVIMALMVMGAGWQELSISFERFYQYLRSNLQHCFFFKIRLMRKHKKVPVGQVL